MSSQQKNIQSRDKLLNYKANILDAVQMLINLVIDTLTLTQIALFIFFNNEK